MFAIIEDRGRQYDVAEEKSIVIDRLKAEIGEKIEMPVLFCEKDGDVKIGTPTVEGLTAKCEVLSHIRGKKGIAAVFKKRKDSKRRKGFRHDQTTVKVLSID